MKVSRDTWRQTVTNTAIIAITIRIVSTSPSMNNYSDTIQDLTACHSVTIGIETAETPTTSTVRDAVGDATIYLAIPEDLFGNLQADLPKMNQKKDKLLKELDKMNKMVSGATYRVNATPEAQESHSKRIASIQEKISRIDYIQNLVQRC